MYLNPTTTSMTPTMSASEKKQRAAAAVVERKGHKMTFFFENLFSLK